jgi:hypothetical protein
MVVFPGTIPIAEPYEFMVATAGLELIQFATMVAAVFEPSDQVAVATNCCLEPTVKSSGVPGDITIEDNVTPEVVEVDEDVTFDEQAAIFRFTIAIVIENR